MNKYFIITLAFLFFIFSASAQDLIITKNGDDIKAKVIEVDLFQVKYKKYENIDGPIYTILIKDLLIIRYENGSKDFFKRSKNNDNSVKSQVKASNIISITPTKLITGIAIGYSNIKQNATIKSQNFSSNNPAINLSLLFEKEFNTQFKFSTRPEFLIGSIINTKFKDDNKEYSYSYSTAIIQMPLLLIYTFRNKKNKNGFPDYFYFGPQLSYNILNANAIITLTENRRNVPLFVKQNETNFKFGIGYDFKLKYVNFRPEFGYSYGFNVLKPNTIPNFDFTSINNNHYSFNIVLSQRYNKVVFRKSQKFKIPLWKKILSI